MIRFKDNGVLNITSPFRVLIIIYMAKCGIWNLLRAFTFTIHSISYIRLIHTNANASIVD